MQIETQKLYVIMLQEKTNATRNMYEQGKEKG